MGKFRTATGVALAGLAAASVMAVGAGTASATTLGDGGCYIAGQPHTRLYIYWQENQQSPVVSNYQVKYYDQNDFNGAWDNTAPPRTISFPFVPGASAPQLCTFFTSRDYQGAP